MVIEFVVAFLGIWACQALFAGFPRFGLDHIAIVSVAIALVTYAVTEMPGGYVSHYGRAVLAWIAGTAVLSIYFTLLPRYTGHPYAYLESALAVGVLIGLTELVVAPKDAAQAHGAH